MSLTEVLMYRREVRAAIMALLAVIVLAFLLPGCGKLKNQGPVPPNFPPEVFLANIPIDSSAWLSNPTVHWYGTDRDGYITLYRYDVVTFDSMPTNDNGQLCPECYLEQARQNGYEGWEVLSVDKDPVSTSAKVRLYAAEDPTVFLEQYFFVQAEDNFGARSEVKYRVFKRANHVPDTRVHMSFGPFIAGTCSDACTQISGISVQWEGSDLLDYPGKQPDFEYEWNVYGPFGGTMVDDTTIVVDTEGVIWDNFLVDHSWNSDSTDVWTTQTATSLTRLFRGVGSGGTDSTLSGFFVFKVRSRDDAYAPDPTPAISAFEAIQPGCERGIMLIDNSHYSNKIPGQLWGDCAKQNCDDFGGDLNEQVYFPYWRGLFDEAGYQLDTIYHRLKGNILDVPPARDLITKYKLVVLVDEGYFQSPTGNLSWFDRLAEYMDIGGKVMVFGRNQFAVLFQGTPGVVPITFSDIPYQYFTLEGQYCPIWIDTWVCFKLTCTCNHSNEEFIGAGSLVADLPDIRVDFTRLGQTYGGTGAFGCDGKPWNHDPWKVNNNTEFTPYPYRGIPAVNFYESSGAGEGLYLAYSVYGSEGALNGGVCGVRYDTGCFKSAAFSFPLYEINRDDAVALLHGMIEWFDIE